MSLGHIQCTKSLRRKGESTNLCRRDTFTAKLSTDPSAKGQDMHKKFCSMLVQLSRPQSLDGLYLLQTLEMKDLRFRPHDALLTEMERLYKLEEETIRAWTRL